jgi:hypothetical protein
MQSMAAHEWRRQLVALALYGLLAVAFTWPLPARLSTGLPGLVTGDTGVYVWNHWVFHHELVHERRLPLVTRHIFSLDDEPADLSLHNYTVFTDLLALPLLPIFGPVASFNLLYLFITILTGFAMFLLAREVLAEHQRGEPTNTRSASPLAPGRPFTELAPAWLAGALFAFSPTLVARSTDHFSLVIAAPLAVFLLLLLRGIRTGRLRYAVGAGAAMAWAAFSDPYYGVYCLMLGTLFIVGRVVDVTRSCSEPSAPVRFVGRVVNVLLVALGAVVGWLVATGGGTFRLGGLAIRMETLYTPVLGLTALAVGRLVVVARPSVRLRRPFAVRAGLKQIVTAGLTCAVVMSPILYPLAKRVASGRYVDVPVLWRSSTPGVDALAFFMPNPTHKLFGGPWREYLSTLHGGFVENVASMTFVALAVILFAVARDRLRLPRVWVFMTLLFATLALGPFLVVGSLNTCIPTPWTFLRYLPVVSEARMPARFTVVVLMGVSILFALALHHILARRRGTWGIVLGLAGTALLFEIAPLPRRVYSAEMPAIYRQIAEDPRPVRVLELPFGVRDGLSSVGNFSAASQFYQTYHHKRLIGGYLSRVSDKRRAPYHRLPLRRALVMLSEGRSVPPELGDELKARARGMWLERGQLGYVVIDRRRASPPLVDFAMRVFDLEKLGESGDRELYRPRRVEQAAR